MKPAYTPLPHAKYTLWFGCERCGQIQHIIGDLPGYNAASYWRGDEDVPEDEPWFICGECYKELED